MWIAGQNPRLPQNTIRRLCSQAQAGDLESRRLLLAAHLPFVIYVARQFYQAGHLFEMADLIQLGNLGLIEAIEHFNPQKRSQGRRVLFCTYARYWVAHRIRREIEMCGPIVAVPINLQRLVRRWHVELWTRQEQPTMPAVVSSDRWLAAQGASARPLSTDWDETEEDVGLQLRGNSKENPEEVCLNREERQCLERLLCLLPLRERFVIQERYGLVPGGEPKALATIAVKLGISNERVRQIEGRALGMLKVYAKQWAIS